MAFRAAVRLLVCAFALASLSAAAESDDVSKRITLQEAAALALTNSPALASFEWGIRAAEANELQSGLRPNPELSLEIEDVRWNQGPDAHTATTTRAADGSVAIDHSTERGTRGGIAESQATLRLSQAVELGGKRVKRVRLAGYQKDLARWDYEVARLDVLAHVAKAFVEALGAQERLSLAKDNVAVAERMAAAVAARVEAGKASPIETTKSETERAEAKASENEALGKLHAALAELAGTWGATPPDIGGVEGDFQAAAPPPSYEEMAQEIAKNPDVARWTDEIAARQAALELERAQRVPDLTVGIGLRTLGLASHSQFDWTEEGGHVASVSEGRTGFGSSHQESLVFEIGLPLPVFDRNQGKIKEAECEAARAHEDRRRAEVETRAQLRAAYETLAHAYDSVVALRDEVLPRAADVLDRVQEGYRQGKFGYLEVLDAQRTLFDARGKYLDALAAYHQAATDADRLAGRSVKVAGAPEHSTEKQEGTGHANP